jgi:putative ABC transport system permease protein
VNTTPPKLARWLLLRILREDLAEEVDGDLEEKFCQTRKIKSSFRAKLNYWYQVIHYLRPFAMRKRKSTLIHPDMLQNYFRISWRNLVRQKMYSTIKIGGLALGIAACFLIALYIIDEVSYDQHHENGDRIYRVLGVLEGDETTYDVDFPAPAANAFESDYIEVEKAGRMNPNTLFGAGANEIRRADRMENNHEEGFTYFDQKLLEMLDPEMISGSAKDALSKPHTLVITRRKAEKYFPEGDAVGKLMIINDNEKQPYTVGGVMEDFPANTSLQYDFLLTLTNVEFWTGEQTWWGASNYPTYLLVKPGVNVKALEKKMTKGIIEKYLMPMAVESGEPNAVEIFKRAHLELQPVRDIHLGANVRDGLPHGDRRFIWLFGAVALFIVLIASINFINLSTARSANRAKEVGLRKTVGSHRSHLISQFLTESFLFTFLAFVIGIILAWITLPYFNVLASKTIAFPWGVWWLLPAIAAGVLLIGLISGVYPAFYLSSFKPINVLKGNVSRGSKSASARSALVVFQFTVSIILIIGTVVIYRQMNFILNKKIGYDKEQVVLLEGAGTLGTKAPQFKEELLKLAQVKHVSICDYLPIRGTKRNGNTFHKEGMQKIEKGVIGQRWDVDADYIKTMGMNLLEGRDFDKDLRSDSGSVIINQAMAKQLNLENPVGARIQNWDVYTVIGVVEDFHFESMKENIQPLCLVLGNSPTLISVKVHSTDMRSALSSITTVWDKFSPNQPIRFNFLDDRYALMYADVQRMGSIFTTFAVLAIIVACLGLFALSAFMVEQRSKEISIRMVLGASVKTIFRLMTQNFVLLVLISFAIATPVAWYLMSQWLQDFVYRTDITWDIFLISGTGALVVALGTVSYQAIRAAVTNPVTNLRSE